MSAETTSAGRLEALLRIMARLRAPEGGCPWDLEQTFATIAPYTIEEAYEVADAIQRGDLGSLKDELGDLLFQVVFHAQMASEAGAFSFADVVDAISEKMIRRHPHVFGDADVKTAEAQTVAWEEHKRRERSARGEIKQRLLDDVPLAFPALTRALKLQKRAATVGFDWRERARVMEKLEEEIGELNDAVASGAPKEKLTDELGDILFVAVNLARHLGVDPEEALRATNDKFTRRFAHVEDTVAKSGRKLADVTLDEMDRAWDEAKTLERRR
ncbi:MAG: nucleoside triphosphate pyrophosphohydrolase [Alphaproteobacteria bacterium]|nr:nucleoside triphosphate pyrophosphohydrolase [Alphaproteobacteria bacterium]